jgi:hypothetical protein
MRFINYCKKAGQGVNVVLKPRKSVFSDEIDFREELSMYKSLDNKISNEIFMKNVLGLK